MSRKQPLLFREFRREKRFFGGAYLGQSKKSHAKSARVLDSKAPIHLVLRSTLASGDKSFFKKAKRIKDKLFALAATNGIKIYDYANVGNHMHIIIQIPSRRLYIRFIRAFSGIVARMMTGAERGTAKRIQFWDQRPFTRVLSSWREPYRILKRYLEKNKLQALGFDAISAANLARMGVPIPAVPS